MAHAKHFITFPVKFNVEVIYLHELLINIIISLTILSIMAEKRNYSYSDIDMCLASQIIAKSFSLNLAELATYRTTWTPEYATDLELRIDANIEEYLGIDPKKELKVASAILSSLTIPAKKDLAVFKTLVDIDFKKKSPKHTEILLLLGITKYLKAVQQGEQGALIELLYTFKNNMTDALKTDVTAKGMNPNLVDRLLGFGSTIKSANINQESLKGTTKEISKEGVMAFNDMYGEIIGICKLSAKHFKKDSDKKELFTFKKVVAHMTSGHTK